MVAQEVRGIMEWRGGGAERMSPVAMVGVKVAALAKSKNQQTTYVHYVTYVHKSCHSA